MTDQRQLAQPDGTPDPGYAAAPHPRFARWIIDICTRPRDQTWLDGLHAAWTKAVMLNVTLWTRADVAAEDW